MNDLSNDLALEESTEDDFTNEFSIYLNLPSTRIHRKLAHLKQGGMDQFEWKTQPYNLELSDPHLVLLGGIQEALRILDKHKIKGGQLTFHIPSSVIAETLNKQECNDTEYRQLWDVFFRKIRKAGHSVNAIEVDQGLADMQTEEAFAIRPKPEKDEVWKPLPGTDGRYEVSSLGRVKSLCSNGRKAKDGIMKPFIKWNHRKSGGARKGYWHVNVYEEEGGIFTPRKVESLLLEAFIGKKPRGHAIAHWDDNSANNCLGNLRYDLQANNNNDQRFNNPKKGRIVEKLQPNQQAVFWDHWTERLATVSG